jgi:Tetrapyrrole (Corrin/Porphyrin) Methylases
MDEGDRPKSGSLIVVGTGIRVLGQLTMEAIAWIKLADRVLYLVGDPVARTAIEQLNPGRCESLKGCYAEGKPRLETYGEMVERALAHVRAGRLTCLAMYGHPGLFATPTHEAVRRARAEGYPARILPGISAEDCLFADLGIDPAITGWQSYDAADFLWYGRTVDPRSAVILWQIGIMGDPLYHEGDYDRSALPSLVARLGQFYPAGHVAYIYQAASSPNVPPLVQPTPIGALAQQAMTSGSTLYIPPLGALAPGPVVASDPNAWMSAEEARST